VWPGPREQPWRGPSHSWPTASELVDPRRPDYRLLVRKLNPLPRIRPSGPWEARLKKYSRGLTIIRSQQCPHIAKFAGEIAQAAEREYKIKPRIVEIGSPPRSAGMRPTPYAVFAVLPTMAGSGGPSISLTRFRNIMKKCPRGKNARSARRDSRVPAETSEWRRGGEQGKAKTRSTPPLPVLPTPNPLAEAGLPRAGLPPAIRRPHFMNRVVLAGARNFHAAGPGEQVDLFVGEAEA